MKIQFIGTGSIGAIERSACTLINDEILVDLGNGNLKTIKQYGNNLLGIKALFITHLHGDHFADIPFFILNRGVLRNKIKEDFIIYGPEKLEEKTKIVFEEFFGEYNHKKEVARVNFKVVEENKQEEINGYEITPYLVDHGKIKPAYGYVISKDKKTIGFSGDSIYCKAIDEIVKNSDIAVLDMSAEKEVPYHMGLDDIIKICEKYPDKKIVATHIQEETRELTKNLNIANLVIPTDGDIIEF